MSRNVPQTMELIVSQREILRDMVRDIDSHVPQPPALFYAPFHRFTTPPDRLSPESLDISLPWYDRLYRTQFCKVRNIDRE